MAYPAYPRFTGEPLAVTNPIGFADGIASVGNLIDALSQRRIQNARQDELLALQRQDRELAQAKEARMEAQGLRKSKFERMKADQEGYRRQVERSARGQDLEPILTEDAQGNPVWIRPERLPDERPTQSAQPGGVDLPPLLPGGPQDIDTALQGAGGVPGAPELPPTAPPAPIETLQGTPPGPETMAMLNALPFGGGRAAPPEPAQPGPPAGQEPPAGPQPQAQSAIMRPPVVRGASYRALPDLATIENLTEAQLDAGPPGAQPQAPRGARYAYNFPSQEPLIIDQEKARSDLRAQRQFDAEGIQQQLQNPNLLPEARKYLETQLAVTLGGIPPKPGQAILAETGKTARQQTSITSQEGMQDKSIASRESLAADKNKTTIEVAKMRAAKRGGGGAGGGSGLSGAKVNSPMNIPIPQTRYGSRPDMLLSRVDQEWRSLSLDIKLNDQLKGLRRIVQADHNISVTGPDSDLVNAEAFFNFAGATRGGVPVENESKVMWQQRMTWAMKIKDYLARAGLGKVAAEFMAGRELTPEEAAAAQKTMSPEELRMMTVGIRESKKILSQQVAETVKPFASIYGKFSGPGGQLMREHAMSLVNSRLEAAGLPADYNPYPDTSIPAPAMKGQQGGGGSDALEAAVNKLLESKKNGVAK